ESSFATDCRKPCARLGKIPYLLPRCLNDCAMDQGNRRHFVLVTSGMGTAHGGIGVVSEMILSAMQGASRVSVWNHPVGLPRLARISILAAQALVGRLKRPDFVFYEHVHLAAIHSTMPRLSGIPYG